MQKWYSKQTPEINWNFKTQTNILLVLFLIDKYKDKGEREREITFIRGQPCWNKGQQVYNLELY